MAYIKPKYKYKIGDRVKTTTIHNSCAGYFEIGTEVTIIDVDDIRGYSIQDNKGNKVIEIGWKI